MMVLYFKNTVEYFCPATEENWRSHQPLSALIHLAMCDAISERGSRTWNWGGTWESQTGVYDFKKKWGAQDMRYEYFTQIFQNSVLKCSQAELMDNFNGFYVLNFKRLEER